MKPAKAILGYTAAGATIFVAILVPFFLFGTFTNLFAHLGLRVDEMYSGGPKVRSIQASGYTIDVHRPVSPHLLQTESSFVQLDWRPADALPARVDDLVDVDGDGKPDVRVTFDVPHDPKARLHAEVVSLNPSYLSRHDLGKERFSALIVRVDNAIVVRVPLAGR